MALYYYPEQKTLLYCNLDDFTPPEMTKKRPAVVISGRKRIFHLKNELVSIVPLSTTRPVPQKSYHHLMSPDSLPGHLAEEDTWAKCDIILTVALHRLDRITLRSPDDGSRIYVAPKISDDDFRSIQECILHGLQLGSLTQHL